MDEKTLEAWRTRDCLKCQIGMGCPHSKLQRRRLPTPEFVIPSMLATCNHYKIGDKIDG